MTNRTFPQWTTRSYNIRLPNDPCSVWGLNYLAVNRGQTAKCSLAADCKSITELKETQNHTNTLWNHQQSQQGEKLMHACMGRTCRPHTVGPKPASRGRFCCVSERYWSYTPPQRPICDPSSHMRNAAAARLHRASEPCSQWHDSFHCSHSDSERETLNYWRLTHVSSGATSSPVSSGVGLECKT